MSLWEEITLALLIIFATIQITGQLGIFTGGINTYTVVETFDIYAHASGAAALGAVLLQFVRLPGRYDLFWRAWIPFQVAVIGVIWETVELAITWFGLLPPEQMWATVENSVQDVFVDFLGVCSISFLYELVAK